MEYKLCLSLCLITKSSEINIPRRLENDPFFLTVLLFSCCFLVTFFQVSFLFLFYLSIILRIYEPM
jgi:hypothetical protein